MRYMLAGALVVVAAGVGRAEEPAAPHGLIGMERGDVRNVFGCPISAVFWWRGACRWRHR